MRGGWLGLGVLAVAGAVVVARGQRPPEGVPLPNGHAITPAGQQTEVGSFPVHMALSPDGKHLVVTNTGSRQYLTVLRVRDGVIASQLDFNGPRKDLPGRKESLYYGLAFGPAEGGGAATLYVSRGAEDRVGVYRLDADGKLTDTGRRLENPSGLASERWPHHVAGLALSGDGSRLYAVNNNTHAFNEERGSLSILETASGRRVGKVPVAGFPFAVAALTKGPEAGKKVYVSSERDGVVSVVDPEAGKVVREIATGEQPLALALNRAQDRLFVANASSDTLSVVDTRTDRVVRTVLLRPAELRGLPGFTPTGFALTPDERRLYVTLADLNAVAVVDPGAGKVLGFIPTGWYPTSVLVSPDGKRLFVANAKGAAARIPNAAPVGPEGKLGQQILNLIEGTVSSLELPDGEELRRMTLRVLENAQLGPGMAKKTLAGFRNPGIEHVIYVIKENRTYDHVLGDLPGGNGDPKLCLFPRAVTPNQHAFAERFVLLDNFYCAAEVSADGWNWSTAGMANEYTARNTPYSYSGRGRSFDYEGQNNGEAPDLEDRRDVAAPPGGYLWDLAVKHGIPFRNYGCFQNGPSETRGPDGKLLSQPNAPTKKALQDTSDRDYLRFDMTYADSDAWVIHSAPSPDQLRKYGRFDAPSRFAEWKREWDGYVRRGDLPKLQMIRLPRDHTAFTTPGLHSPRSMVADNDYAVGQIVETVSRSPYWKKTAIFFIEDDAQSGHDHVDAHRSTCFVVSPFVRRGTVDHRFYNTDSVLRTIELLLGLPPMCQYDATAAPLPIFGERPENDAPIAAILPPREILAEVNTRTAYRAADSRRFLRLGVDAGPEGELNEILWRAVKR